MNVHVQVHVHVRVNVNVRVLMLWHGQRRVQRRVWRRVQRHVRSKAEAMLTCRSSGSLLRIMSCSRSTVFLRSLASQPASCRMIEKVPTLMKICATITTHLATARGATSRRAHRATAHGSIACRATARRATARRAPVGLRCSRGSISGRCV